MPEVEPTWANDALIAIRRVDYRRQLIDTVFEAVADVRAGRAQRILLAARRMTCLYALLRDRGLEEPEGRDVVLSDRFMELLPDDAWNGQRVLLLDDTRITGKTMEERESRARRLIGASGSVETRIAIEDGALAGEEESPEETAARLAETVELHGQFAHAFGRNLLPFFTDFCISRAADGVSEETLEEVLDCQDWRTVEVTNSVLAGTGARAFSLFLSGATLERFEGAIGDAARLVDIAKVRIFTAVRNGQLQLKVVPIVLTRSFTRESVDEWLGGIGVTPRDTPAQLSTAAGLVTVMLSRRLLEVFGLILEEKFGLRIEEDTQFAGLMLGEEGNRLAAATNGESLAGLKTVESASVRLAEPEFVWPQARPSQDAHRFVVGDDVVEPFFDAIQGPNGHSKQRITLAQLAERTSSSTAAASVAIDILNDLGFSVPSFEVGETLVARAYRAGEAYGATVDNLFEGYRGGRLAAVEATIGVRDPRQVAQVGRVLGSPTKYTERRPPGWAPRPSSEPVQDFSGETPYEICQRYADGDIGRSQLVDELARFPYAAQRTPDSYDGLVVNPPGTWSELSAAVRRGFIDDAIYAEVFDLYKGRGR